MSVTRLFVLATLVPGCILFPTSESPPPPAPEQTVRAAVDLAPTGDAAVRGTLSVQGSPEVLRFDGNLARVPEGTYAVHLLPPGRCAAIDLSGELPLLEVGDGKPAPPNWTVLPEEAYDVGAYLSGSARIPGVDAQADLEGYRVVVTRIDGTPRGAPVPVACGVIRNEGGPGT